MKKFFLKTLFLMPTLVLPSTLVVSCGETNRFFLAQRDLKDFLRRVEKNQISFQNYQNQEAISEIKYLKYLLDSPNAKDKYMINYFQDRLELKVFVPFLQSNEQKDITTTSLGRMMKIAHGNHFHTRFVTWDELGPTKEEKKQGNLKGYKYTFENVKAEGKIDWNKIKLENDFLKSDNFPKLINLNKNQEKNFSFKKGINTSKYFLTKDFIQEISNEFSSQKEEIQKLTNKPYIDKTEENETWQYNAEHENLLLSDASLNLGVDLIKIFTQSKDTKINFGFDKKQMKPELLNYWFVNKPNSHKFDHEEGKEQKDEIISGLVNLSEKQLEKLNKIDQGNKEWESFLNSLEPNARKKFLENIDKFQSILPKKNYQNVEMKLYWFKDKNGDKKYVDNIFVLVRALYGDLIKIKNPYQDNVSSYYLVDKNAREIKNDLFFRSNTKLVNLGFEINLEKAFDWTSKKEPLYYFSQNEKIFKTQEDLNKLLG